MQAKPKTGKQKPSLVYKPYLRGNWHSGLAAKRGLRILVYLLVFMFVYLFIGQVLLFDSVILRTMANLTPRSAWMMSRLRKSP